MKSKDDWTIPLTAGDWECGWEGSELFHLRYFRALPFARKMKAVESMAEVAALLAEKAARRRAPPPSRRSPAKS